MTIQVPELFTSWTFWFVVAAVVVALAATLLIAILLVAKSIHGHAARALAAVQRIDGHTAPIWRLQGVLTDMQRIRAAGAGVAAKAEMLAGAVHGAEGGARSGGGGAP